MDSSSLKVVVRPAEFSDEAFIMASWLNGNRYGNTYFEDIEPNMYFKAYAERIKKIFQTPNIQIDIACLESDPGTILGYMVWHDSVIHWAFVKSDYRNQKIARALFGTKRFMCSTGTSRIGRSLMKKYGIHFNPFIGENK